MTADRHPFFLHCASFRDVAALPVLRRSLSIPMKRFDKPMPGYLFREEMDAVLAACNRSTWSGERDFVLLSVAYNTGARVSELVALNIEDVEFAKGRWIPRARQGPQIAFDSALEEDCCALAVVNQESRRCTSR